MLALPSPKLANGRDKCTMDGFKHMVECNCILPHLKSSANPPFHQFVVFSVMKDDIVIPKYTQCNNCEVVHNVIDVCRSKIIGGRDELRSIRTIDDIRLAIPSDVKDVLDSYDCSLATWEHVEFVLEHKKWGSSVIISRDYIDEKIEGKQLVFEREGKIKMKPFIINTNIS